MSFIIKCVLFLEICLLHISSGQDSLPTCQMDDFHWQYTECDSAGNRWKVQVPDPDKCTGGAPRPPEKGRNCGFTCEAGKFLDIQDDQECKPCPKGTFSLGGGVRFEDWEELPIGFSTTTERFPGLIGSRMFFANDDENEQSEKTPNITVTQIDECATFAWTPNGQVISSIPGYCASTLSYTVNLVQPGTVNYEYQFEDENTLLKFELKNSQCESMDADPSQWPKATKNNKWETKSVPLNSGTNTISFTTMGLGMGVKTGMLKPVRIKAISITGIAFTQECTKCRAGTKLDKEGGTLCEDCPSNTYSQKGASICSPCNDDEYSFAGSSSCTKKPACTDKDYYEFYSVCKDNTTQKSYKWAEPKNCRDGSDMSGAALLPAAGEPEACPPCSRGMFLSSGKCKFCPANHFSNGSSECMPCPENTAPEYGVSIEWWNNLPENINLSSNCLSLSDRGCSSKTGWVTSASSISSAKGHADDSFLLLSITVNGFKGKRQTIGAKSIVTGKISFVFDLKCKSGCVFFFMKKPEADKSDDVEVLGEWNGTVSRQIATFDLHETEPTVFSWAFQKKELSDGSFNFNHDYADDVASIYSLNITNTEFGGAATCKPCPQGANEEGCIPCKAGEYIDHTSKKCMKCPKGTVMLSQNSWGLESCLECGNGLTAKVSSNGDSECVTSCKYDANDGFSYDFTELAKISSAQGTRLFTSSGTQYYHQFNISLCGGGDTFPRATCYDNISDVATGSSEQSTKKAKRKSQLNLVTSLICRSTIIPPKAGDLDVTVSAQPSSIGDILINITNDGSSIGMAEKMAMAGFTDTKEDREDVADVHFVYRSESPTASCKDGRTSIITLRCDISAKGVGNIQLPPKCSDGTCDGCNFHFLWRSNKACPICKSEIYKEMKGECVQGEQEIHYIGPKYCPESNKGHRLKCSVLPFWLQVSIAGMCGVGVMLCILIIYCWKHNRKLEYKYMKLVGTSENKNGEHELPAAETCALSEDEDEQFDAVNFKDSKTNRFFNKIKIMGKKEKDSVFEASAEKSALMG